ncbi:ABC transporter substrate-binding protein [Nostoc sp. DedQUE07]|uniref:ABC transporter substrate-binding protein n=1 Tax=Nostoc sp. DedQUE07 TaxID=3075392 RepID=UPI002AD4B1FC|nr:ABC transporter substrate-binding protein [Nostoc sp. DedQUE07]MDZ8128133.1 ABC transporter substrate-binding protein [Nostoc sp. DedQUE07]
MVFRRNPYIIGRPIDDPKLLFGRGDLFDFIKDNLSQGVKITLLHGQRRIGKSSIIRNIPKFVQLEDFVFISFNLEDYSGDNFYKILAELSKEIIDHLQLDAEKIKPPSIPDLEKEAYIFYSEFLTKVYDELVGKKIVLVLDEFEALITPISASLLDEFFTYLYSIIEVEDKLFLIMFAGRQSANMPNLLDYFQDVSIYEIGFLNENSATQLITQPAEGILEYEPEAIQAIIELSAGHPYFIQVICFAIFVRARELDEWYINQEDIDNIVDKAIENAEAGLAWFWEGLNIPEKVVFSAVAESQKIAIEKSQIVLENPFILLKNFGIVKTRVMEQAVKELVAYNFLDDTGDRIKIELVRRWLLQRHPLRQEIKELEKFNQKESYSNYEAKKYLTIEEKKTNNLAIYNTARTQNSSSLKSELFWTALELEVQADRANTVRKKQFLYADKLKQQHHWKEAKYLFNKVLDIEPLKIFAQSNKQEIEVIEEEEKKQNILKGEHYSPEKWRLSKRMHLGIIVVSMGIAAIAGIGISRLSTPCLVSENKVLGVFCIDDPSINFSSGERTFFPIINNADRDQGIKAFKQEKYQEASKLFEEAIKANRNDPEVRIYYNNALARDKRNPITLAVAVPADNKTNFAQEILRGVAQAQQEFNTKNGLNNRLLEIKIANDANKPEQAKQVAAELVKDKSILGVIGHNNSESTKAALEEYNKTYIPIISPSSTSTQLQSKNFFRSLPSDAAEAKQLAKYAFDKKLTKVVIFSNPDSLYSDSMREEFTKIFESLGGKVLHKPEINLADTSLDMDSEVRISIYRDKVEAAVLIPDRKHISIALKIARANQDVVDSSKSRNRAIAGLKLLAGDNLYSNDILTQGGNAVEGLIIVVPWFREAPQAINFAEKAKKLWGGEVSWRTATSYDATQAFIQALSSNSNRTTILERLENAKFSVNETSGYPLKFNSEGERETEPILVQIKSGKFVAVP